MYTWITTSSGRSSMSFMPGFSTCSSVMVTSSLSSRYAARLASPNGGNREYLIGRNSGLVASVSAGRIIFTLMPRGYNGALYIAKYSLFLHDQAIGSSGNDLQRSGGFTCGGLEKQKPVAVQFPFTHGFLRTVGRRDADIDEGLIRLQFKSCAAT